MEMVILAQDLNTGLGSCVPALPKLPKSGCVKGTVRYHCRNALKLQSIASSQVKVTKLGSALWGSSIACALSSSDEFKASQRSISGRASVEAPATPPKTTIVRSADTAGASAERPRISAGRLDEVVFRLLRRLADANCVSQAAVGAEISHGQVLTFAERAYQSSRHKGQGMAGQIPYGSNSSCYFSQP